ncbi:hypothetical protein QYF61_026553 [Mycteria americana]|uniref:Uncharacterized protein n=1 Tax=Mycteria americana TaxID=33587 RepID=A0AAN7SAC3_MYCAM|nr:hypothetical protein QYF61_026553 [Mycteria americana]
MPRCQLPFPLLPEACNAAQQLESERSRSPLSSHHCMPLASGRHRHGCNAAAAQRRCPGGVSLPSQPHTPTHSSKGPAQGHGYDLQWSQCQPQPSPHAGDKTNLNSLQLLAQDTVGLLGCECTLLAYVHLFIHQYPQVLFRRAALNHIIPQPDPALGLVEPHEVQQLVQVPLDDIPSFWRVSCTTQLGVVCKLAEGALSLAVNVIEDNIEQHWSQYGPLRDTTHH